MKVSPKQFTIYWCNLEPTFGRQMQKTRPCAVVSPDEMNDTLGTVIVVPLTSTMRSLPFYLSVNYGNHPGALACDQIKTIDKRRASQILAPLSAKDRASLSAILTAMFSPD
ncbi:MAG: type II toxin-antitoxin system PemK/MazF family toxin [Candidatus Saccharimonadales bacterium]